MIPFIVIMAQNRAEKIYIFVFILSLNQKKIIPHNLKRTIYGGINLLFMISFCTQTICKESKLGSVSNICIDQIQMIDNQAFMILTFFFSFFK